MGQTTEISWCDSTFNPWLGCAKVSPGCQNCYAEELMDRRYGRVKWGKGQPRVRTSAANWKLPLKWNREAHLMVECVGCNARYILPEGHEESFCKACGHPEGNSVRPRVFCASLADWLDEEVPIEWLADLLKLIHDTPNLDWLLLTKRPETWRERITAARNSLTKGGCADTALWLHEWLPEPELKGVYNRGKQATAGHPGKVGDAPPNVWIGTTCENQEMADKRIPELLKIPAKVRFLSMEPLLGPVDLTSVKRTVAPGFFGDCLQWYHRGSCHNKEDISYPTISWIIAGGESGPNARPSHPDWFRSIRDQCQAAGVPFLFKQWGEFSYDLANPIPTKFPGKFSYTLARVGKKAAGRLLDGREWNEFPNLK